MTSVLNVSMNEHATDIDHIEEDDDLLQPLPKLHDTIAAIDTAFFRDRPIFFIGLSRCRQNAVIFVTHPDSLRKKAQRCKSRQLSYNNARRCGFINKQTTLTMEHASVVAAETKASSGSFAMLSYHVQVLCTNKLPLYFQTFSQHKTFDCNLQLQKLIDA